MNKKQKWQHYIENLCWQNFLQSGSIGHYLLYYNIKQEKTYEHTGFNNKKHCSKNGELSRE